MNYENKNSYQNVVRFALKSHERHNVSIYTGDNSWNTLLELYETNLIRQFDTTSAMKKLITKTNQSAVADVNDTRFYK